MIRSRYWLGGNDIAEEGRYIWSSDGAEIPLDRFWNPNEPDHSGTDDTVDCVMMQQTGFSDVYCDRISEAFWKSFACAIP